jgi:hypothetical protein
MDRDGGRKRADCPTSTTETGVEVASTDGCLTKGKIKGTSMGMSLDGIDRGQGSKNR